MNRAFAYARKSKEDKDDPKWSIPTQIERVRESAERRGETFAGAFEDRDVSGARPFAERPGWAALEAQLQPGDAFAPPSNRRAAGRDSKEGDNT